MRSGRGPRLLPRKRCAARWPNTARPSRMPAPAFRSAERPFANALLSSAQLLHTRRNAMVRITLRRLVPLLTVVLLVALESTASAQYFGRNKVQYKNLNFEVLKTEHFDIYFYPEEREGIDIAARMAERWHARLERVLAHQLRGRQPLVLYASHPDFEQTNAIEGELGEGTGGVTEPLRRRIVLPMGGPLSDTDHVIGHELVHAFQFDITTPHNTPPGQNGAERLPLWC